MATQAATVARSSTSLDRQALKNVVGRWPRWPARAGRHRGPLHYQPDGQARARALAEVAGALAAKGDTRQAHHMASAACAVGQWTTVLELVLSLEPSALRVLTDL